MRGRRFVLVEPDDMPSKIIIHWPGQSTTANPRDFRDMAAMLTKVFVRAATKLTQIRRGDRRGER